MRKLITVFLVLLSFVLVAQDNLSNELYISSGYNIPQDPPYFSEYWSNALNLNLGFNYPINNYLILQADLGVNTFLFNEVEYKNLIEEYLAYKEVIVSGGLKQLYIFSLGIKIPFKNVINENIYPYLRGGGGFVHNTTNDIILSFTVPESNGQEEFDARYRIVSNSETVPHLYSGIGINFKFSEQINLFLEGTYNYSRTKNSNEDEIPIDLVGSYKDRELTYLYFRLGIVYSLPD